MTPRIEKLLALLRSGEYKALRDPSLLDNTPPAEITNVFLADAYRLKTLLDAQIHPENHRNLQVRVCGWNALWNNICKEEQDGFIRQAEELA